MKILFSLLFVPMVLFGQCPGSTAINYKNQAQSLGADEFSKREAYIYLATYYAYKCECENGSPRAAQMVGMINGLVDTYAAYTQNAYGVIQKVSTCNSASENVDNNTLADSNNPYFKMNNFYNSLETAGNALFGEDSGVGRFVQNLNVSNQMWGNIESGNYLGAASNLISLFSNSRRRKPKPLSQEEIDRIERLQEQRQKAQRIAIFNAGMSQVGVARINDTTMIRIGEGEKLIITHKPYTGGELIMNSRRTYDLSTNDLLTETIVNERYADGTIKRSTETYYEKGISEQTVNNQAGEVVKVTDLISQEIVYAREGRIKKDLLDSKGRKIGERFIYDNVPYIDNYIDKDDFIHKSIHYNGGIPNYEYHYIFKDNTSIPVVVIDYDSQGYIRKKTMADYKQIMKNMRIVVLYDKGLPVQELTYKDGDLIKQKEL